MKKIIVCLFIVSLFVISNKKDNDIIIPDNAIRFRVIANSNDTIDQQKKMIIKEKIETEVYDLINNANTNEEVKNILNNNMNKIEDIVKSYNIPYNINYGLNEFPTKNYKGVMYKEGLYESLVITLGEGMGNNFWCVLFPPLCLLDNNSEDISDIEYKSLVKTLIDKL